MTFAVTHWCCGPESATASTVKWIKNTRSSKTGFPVWLTNREGISLTFCELLCCRLWCCRWWSNTAEDPAHQQRVIIWVSQSLYPQNSPHTQGKRDMEVRGLRGLSQSCVRRKTQKSAARKGITVTYVHRHQDPSLSLSARSLWPRYRCTEGKYTVSYYYSIPDIRGHTEKVSFHLHRRPF